MEPAANPLPGGVSAMDSASPHPATGAPSIARPVGTPPASCGATLGAPVHGEGQIKPQPPSSSRPSPATAGGAEGGDHSPSQPHHSSLTLAANPLPYRDTKPVGAADFYLAINATFRFIHNKFGPAGLRQYWTDLGSRYSAPVTEKWRAGGLPAIAAHWRAFFAAEPGAVVVVHEENETVAVAVQVCPAIQHLRANQREILPCFCQHCYFLSEAIAAPAGYTVRITGGNGACRQTFHRRAAAPPPQDLAHITEAASC